MKILFTASKVYPLIKTGGLADVVGSLPNVLAEEGHEVRLLLPLYSGINVKEIHLNAGPVLGNPFGFGQMRLQVGHIPNATVTLLLLDCPDLFSRDGGPYLQLDGSDYPDNHRRFAMLAWTGAVLSAYGNLIDWQPDIVHAHDWQTGLVPAYLKSWRQRVPKVVFTIHNLQYTGFFEAALYSELGLGEDMYDPEGLEYYGGFSMLKAGIQYSDAITTVSPTYTQEIQTEAYGCGFDGLLRSQQNKLTGILNGVDYDVWNPDTDPFIVANYNVHKLDDKQVNKHALRERCRLEPHNGLLFGIVSRLTTQKGLDLVLEAMPQFIDQGAQMVLLGSGDKSLEEAFLQFGQQYAGQVSIHIDYDEVFAHLIQAGVDCLLIPSRFEPCGLTQLFALKYGTLPIVRHTGGLADSVWENKENLPQTGFVFDQSAVEDLSEALSRALILYQDREAWRQIQRNAMRQDFTWEKAGKNYIQLYQSIVGER